MPTPEAAQAHYLTQQRIAAVVVAAMRAAWHRLDIDDLDGSWRTERRRMFATIVNGQTVSAGQADPYLDRVLVEQHIDPIRTATVSASAFAGTASDGRDLQTLLYEPVITTKVAVAAGRTPPEAFAAGEAAFIRITATQVTDAGRTAVATGIAARPRVTSWTRMLNPPSCARCVILAGKVYRWNAGFHRHPHCVPAGVEVSGPESLATTRRWYEGELVIISTASGKQLPATSNHPILTDHGWLPAHLLREGDQTVSSVLGQGARPLVVPDVRQMPASIEDVTVPFGVSFDGMPSATKDFHGDGGHGDVDAVLADRLLWDRMLSSHCQPFSEHLFGLGAEAALEFPPHSVSAQTLIGTFTATRCNMRGSGLGEALFWSHQRGAVLAGIGSSADGRASIEQVTANDSCADSVPSTETQFAFTREIGRGDLIAGEMDHSPRWDAPLGSYSMETLSAYARRGNDLLLRLTGQVALDRVIDIRRVQWSGHVYNLSSSEGWYSANGLIVSNCDCQHVPSIENVAGDFTTDPAVYFNRLSTADQDRYFTKAGAETIRQGGDMNQVVNARQGMYQANGQTFTTVGTTKRGLAGQRLQGAQRLMPESIVAQAGDDRALAVTLLRQHGFLA